MWDFYHRCAATTSAETVSCKHVHMDQYCYNMSNFCRNFGIKSVCLPVEHFWSPFSSKFFQPWSSRYVNTDFVSFEGVVA